ncbi:MAG: hypothetical protein AAB468_00095 [Patescibacteria group bacterium]
MNIVRVIPIARGVFKDELSYFAQDSVESGTMVNVSVRGKKIPALVIESLAASQFKAAIKSAPYALKKIDRIKTAGFLQPAFLAAARRAADYFAAPLGATLRQLLPQTILDAHQTLNGGPGGPKPSGPQPEKLTLQEPEAERLAFYKNLIRSEFAKHHSVFLCLPTGGEVERVASQLEKGIEDYTFVLHSKLGRKQLLTNWQAGAHTAHPCLLLGTPTYLSIPRPDLSLIIIDQENSSAYKSLSRPFIDHRLFAELLASALGVRLVIGDTVLRTETVYRTEKGELTPASAPKHRSFSNAEQKIVELEYKREVEFMPISPLVHDLLGQAVGHGERTFIFVHRRGLSSTIVCQDCGTIVLCARCSSPLVWHKTEGEVDDYFLACHKCRATRTVTERCSHCRGWRLYALGIGLERVEAALAASYPNWPLYRLDSDTVKNSRQATVIVKKFLSSNGGLLLGTEQALYYLKEKIENSVVLAIDSLFTLPDFRINEKGFGLMIKIRSLASKRFAIQTKDPNRPIFQHVIKGNLLDFYRDEIVERRQFGYPPFKLLIKITRRGARAAVLTETHQLAEWLTDYEPEVYSAFTAEVKGQHIRHVLLKLDPRRWPDPNLLNKLRSLPPDFEVDVDPESIL